MTWDAESYKSEGGVVRCASAVPVTGSEWIQKAKNKNSRPENRLDNHAHFGMIVKSMTADPINPSQAQKPGAT